MTKVATMRDQPIEADFAYIRVKVTDDECEIVRTHVACVLRSDYEREPEYVTRGAKVEAEQQMGHDLLHPKAYGAEYYPNIEALRSAQGN